MDVVNDLISLALDSSKDPVKCIQKVEKFNKDNESVFGYSSLLTQTDHDNLLESVFKILLNTSFKDTLHLKLLCLLRLLSRDKQLVCNIGDTEKHITSFVQYLENAEKNTDDEKLCPVQALMCLCNWIYHSQEIRTSLIKLDFIKKMLTQLEANGFKLENYLFYQIRVLFLMSALENDERQTALECGGIIISVDILEKVLANLKTSSSLDEMNDKILSEVLKALFNITRELSNCSSENILQACTSLVVALRELIKIKMVQDSESLVAHISHVFVNLPKQPLEYLCPQVQTIEDEKKMFLDHPLHFQNRDMSSIILLLESLQDSMKEKTYNTMMETSLAVLTAFCYICRKIPFIRKFLRQEILPPLVITNIRPEKREDTCGEIVRLMTFVDVMLKNMAADFIFVLCKENVTRLIRYSGYGNCAGYLASRGLMVPVVRHADGEYSDDELSDVDEDLDEMTGATAQPKVNILDNLTEEEKEEEAMKLMELFDKLSGPNSLIKPMTVNNDGKLVELDLFGNEKDEDDD